MKRETSTYEVRNPGPGLGQAQQYGRVKLVNEIPTLVCKMYINVALLSMAHGPQVNRYLSWYVFNK
jgi:hypothetical protein